MNEYKTSFFAQCPNNQIRIHYFLSIKTTHVIQVEKLLEFVGQMTTGFHETFADELTAQFGGLQTLEADHHGVAITTTRGAQ